MLPIAEQLKDYCDCMEIDENFERDVNQLITLVSSLTCWTNKPCETFLSSEREQYFPLEVNPCCGCDYLTMKKELFYEQVKTDSFSVFLIMRDGIKEYEVEIEPEDFYYIQRNNHIKIDLRKYLNQNPCSCEVAEGIIVRYTAGFEEIPNCLLPVFCDMLQYVIAMNKCECPCTTCETDDAEVVVEGDNSEPQASISITVRNYINNAYGTQLGLISLCGKEFHWYGYVI